MRAALTAALLAAAAATMTVTACAPATSARATSGGGADGAEPPPAPTPDPAPQETEKTWTLDAAAFGDDGGSIWAETSNRSAPFAWDAITAGNFDDVRVSIGGVALSGEGRSFTSTAYEPAFEGDYSGAEWTVAAEVTAGAVALLLTAPNQRIDRGDVSHVIVTAAGDLYLNGLPTVEFSAPPAGGRRATGVVLGPGRVQRVQHTPGAPGSGYTSPPAVEFFRTCCGVYDGGEELEVTLNGDSIGPIRILNPGSGFYRASIGGGWSCRFVPRLGGANCRPTIQDHVTGVKVTDGGRGYTSAPTVTITRTGPNGSGATATAVLRGPTGNTEVENLFWARQTLYGKELLLEITAE